jgi:hypothetical protein
MTFTDSQTLPEALGAVEAPSVKGQWQNPFDLPNVGIHAHVMPNGKVLFWGRRIKPGEGDLDVHECTPFLWDPVSKSTTGTPQPTLKDGTKVNLFCSGHTFLPDGRLLVMGGHFKDGYGLNQATIYDYRTNTWTPTALMGGSDDFRRWYPTAVTLSDGTVLVMSGSTTDGGKINDEIQIWNNGNWRSIVNFVGPPLYPRMHLGPDGRVFMSGPNALSQFLDTKNGGNWTPSATRANGNRDYAPSVMYSDINNLEGGKVIYIGGGNNQGTKAPTNAVEIIDLKEMSPTWRPTEPMKFPRRQHNAVLLPDGTVLVTGGTRGGGGPNNGFNDLTPGQPVHEAELWDPTTGKWIELAAEAVDRCYHSTTVLLPDATVLSAGGGEYRPDDRNPNNPKDSHRDAQIFFPPYLFQGPRPDILTSPDEVTYGETFEVGTSKPEEIAHVSWIRLPSITHSFDQNQRINFLASSIEQQKLTVTAPPNSNVCPPGHYMLFLLNKAKVPSVAKIIKISDPLVPALTRSLAENLATSVSQSATERYIQDITDDPDKGTFVEVGLTATCPYGLGACWGGAYEALKQMDAVQCVRPIANAADSTASVYLNHDGLPDIEQWPDQFASTANGSYEFRGVEVTLTGTVERQNGHLVLQGNDVRPAISLLPLEGTDKIQWDRSTGSPKPLEEDERLAYQSLASSIQNTGISPDRVQVTGPLKKNKAGFELYVRKFQHVI